MNDIPNMAAGELTVREAPSRVPIPEKQVGYGRGGGRHRLETQDSRGFARLINE